MERKRKAPNSITTQPTDTHRAKKQKGNIIVLDTDSENEHESDSLEEDEWYIKCILDETDSQYLIDWEGPWSPTWVSYLADSQHRRLLGPSIYVGIVTDKVTPVTRSQKSTQTTVQLACGSSERNDVTLFERRSWLIFHRQTHLFQVL